MPALLVARFTTNLRQLLLLLPRPVLLPQATLLPKTLACSGRHCVSQLRGCHTVLQSECTVLLLAGWPEAAGDLDAREPDAQHDGQPDKDAADVTKDGVTQEICTQHH